MLHFPPLLRGPNKAIRPLSWFSGDVIPKFRTDCQARPSAARAAIASFRTDRHHSHRFVVRFSLCCPYANHAHRLRATSNIAADRPTRWSLRPHRVGSVSSGPPARPLRTIPMTQPFSRRLPCRPSGSPDFALVPIARSLRRRQPEAAQARNHHVGESLTLKYDTHARTLRTPGAASRIPSCHSHRTNSSLILRRIKVDLAGEDRRRRKLAPLGARIVADFRFDGSCQSSREQEISPSTWRRYLPAMCS